MKLYEAQDEVDDKKDALLTEVEQLLAQKIEQAELFTIKCPRFRSWIEEIINRCKE